MAVQDCLLRAKGVYDWVAHIDVDEYLRVASAKLRPSSIAAAELPIPALGGAQALRAELRRAEEMDAGSILLTAWEAANNFEKNSSSPWALEGESFPDDRLITLPSFAPSICVYFIFFFFAVASVFLFIFFFFLFFFFFVSLLSFHSLASREDCTSPAQDSMANCNTALCLLPRSRNRSPRAPSSTRCSRNVAVRTRAMCSAAPLHIYIYI